MLFNSYTFILFLGFVAVIYYLNLPWRARKLFLLLASYLFYAAWNPPFVVLIWISTVADWYLAKAIAACKRRTLRRLFLAGSLVVNLGLLGYFKYGQFAVDNFLALMEMWGWQIQLARPGIVLPVGISFYTFQTLSYTFDVYRGSARPWYSFLDYALFVTFFPQLVAGPIVRAVDFLPQCEEPKKPSGDGLGWGLSLVTLGLFAKITVADGLLAPVADLVYEVGKSPDTVSAWCGTFAFAGQIFCDFAGYSSCALGVALCLGFRLSRNFRFPYAAVGFSDFWRRWHISLSTWLRDYLYISLGGNRRGTHRTVANLMITMLLGGLWHGAAWTFVIWGGLHGLYLMGERLLKKVFSGKSVAGSAMVRFGLAVLTFLLVCVAWVFFRAETLRHAVGIISAMFGVTALAAERLLTRLDVVKVCAITACLLGSHWLLRETTLEASVERFPWWVRSVLLSAMLAAIAIVSGEDRAFIYFQF
jgi:D-alanyl-lipoteichoic acid acyltransferase DltB (MBOAT superfamily)